MSESLFGWRPIDPDKLPAPQPMLVSNKFEARNAHGHMSHVWLVAMLHRQPSGDVQAFGPADARLHGLTHWCPIPTPGEATT